MTQLPPSVQMYGILSTTLCQLNKKHTSSKCHVICGIIHVRSTDVVAIAEEHACLCKHFWDGSIDSIKADRV